MSRSKITTLVATVLLCTTAFAQAIQPEEVKKNMNRVADWQIEHFGEPYSWDEPHHPLDWTNGALYVGMVKWAEIADDDTYYE